MGTKNLARTPLEAGHYPSYKHEKKEINRRNRHKNKYKSHKAKYEEDVDFDYTHVHNCSFKSDRHADTLGAVRRWVESQVGRKWDDVYSEIKKKFPETNIVNKHILDHVRGYIMTEHDQLSFSKYVTFDPETSYHRKGLYIKNGILHRFPVKRMPWKNEQNERNKEIKYLKDWKKNFLNNRVIIYEGGIPFFYEKPYWIEVVAHCKGGFKCRHVAWNKMSADIQPHTYSVKEIKKKRICKLTSEERKAWEDFVYRVNQIDKNYSFVKNEILKE